MRHHEQPNIGSWFKDQESNGIFEVVASDDLDGSIEIQYFAGEIDELDLETWYALDLRRIPPPEDCSGPFESSREELGYPEEVWHPDDWNDPLINIEPGELLR